MVAQFLMFIIFNGNFLSYSYAPGVYYESFLLLITVDENKHFSYVQISRCRVSFAHLQERNIGQMLALIAKVVLFHRQRLVALNLVYESNHF